MDEGYYDAVVSELIAGEIKGDTTVMIRFELPLLGEYVGKTYFLTPKIDRGGKTGLERFKDDLLVLLGIKLGKEATDRDLIENGWDDPRMAIGVKCNVKTRTRIVGDKTYHEVAFINAPRKWNPKWETNDWHAVSALLRGNAPKVAKPKPAPVQMDPTDEELPF